LRRRCATGFTSVLTFERPELDPNSDADRTHTKEFTILEFLMRRAGHATSKAEILGHAWDFAYDGDPNIVEVFVSGLRKKIDTEFGKKNLRTVWGVGYELASDANQAPRRQPNQRDDLPEGETAQNERAASVSRLWPISSLLTREQST
jgi:DNA-binding winged helix-turn-helix (wHTH) protein